MPSTYYVDDGGDNSDGSTWAKAYTSVQSLDSAVALASGDIVYFGHDSACASNGAALTITGPASGIPVYFISATTGSSPATYAAATAVQISTTGGSYNLTFDGSFALYGIKTSAGNATLVLADSDEVFFAENCTFVIAASAQMSYSGSLGRSTLKNCVIDLTNDGTTPRSTTLFYNATGLITEHIGLTFVNPGYRTGVIYAPTAAGILRISSCDFSGFSNATDCEILSGSIGSKIIMTNCLTKSSVTLLAGSCASGAEIMISNCGPQDGPAQLVFDNLSGRVVSVPLDTTPTIYRTGGATIEGIATAWLVTTTANCSEGSPFNTPYIYGTLSSTGSKTFAVYVTNDTADLTDAECWLEVEYLGTSDEAQWSLADGQRTDMTTAAGTNVAPNADDTSTWNGTGPSFTYKQKFAKTVTVNEDGQYRVRLLIAKASIASSSYFYIDPKVTVS